MKEGKYAKILAKIQVWAIFHVRDIRRNGSPKFIRLCIETSSCWCLDRGTKMMNQESLFWNQEFWALESEIQLDKESGIRLTIGIRNPSSTDKDRNHLLRIRNPQRRVQHQRLSLISLHEVSQLFRFRARLRSSVNYIWVVFPTIFMWTNNCDIDLILPSIQFNEHLMTGPSGNRISCFPRDQSLSDLLHSGKFWRWKFIKSSCNGGRRSTFSSNNALLPRWEKQSSYITIQFIFSQY